MVLEFVTYLYTILIFVRFVLLKDDNSFDWAEIVFSSYICVSGPVLLVLLIYMFACAGEGRMCAQFKFHTYEYVYALVWFWLAGTTRAFHFVSLLKLGFCLRSCQTIISFALYRRRRELLQHWRQTTNPAPTPSW